MTPYSSRLHIYQIERKKREGTYKTKKQREQEARAEAAKAVMLAAGLESESFVVGKVFLWCWMAVSTPIY